MALFASRNGGLTLIFCVNFDQDLHFRAIANVISLVLLGSSHLAFTLYIYVQVCMLSPLLNSALFCHLCLLTFRFDYTVHSVQDYF